MDSAQERALFPKSPGSERFFSQATTTSHWGPLHPQSQAGFRLHTWVPQIPAQGWGDKAVKGFVGLGAGAELPKEATGPGMAGNSEVLVPPGTLTSSSSG